MRATDDIIAEARRRHEEGRFGAAADLLLEAFRRTPDRPELSREIGILMRTLGDPEGAVAYLKRAWHHRPDDALTVAELVLSLHELGRPGEAVQVMLSSLDAGLDERVFADCVAEQA